MLRRVALALGCAVGMWAAAGMAQEPRGMIYDFSATWCGPCQQIKPLVNKLEREGLPIRTVDVDQYKDFANKYQITTIPAFVLVIDGKEVDRHTGALSEADLRRMAARIPAASRPAAVNSNAHAVGELPVDLGQPAPFNAPASVPAVAPREETRLVENNERRGLRDLLPLGRRDEQPATPPVVRGNDNTIGAAGDLARAAAADVGISTGDPMRASVRIRVITNGTVQLGSGTVIQSREGISQILTCQHIFSKATADSRIEVDLFDGGNVKQFHAKHLRSDDKADLGLIAINTTTIVPSVPVSGAEGNPRVKDVVSAIGCNGGQNPTRENLSVTDIDKFDGPHNILCTGVPVQGRSGGGLFDQQGRIVGVCSAADEQESRGFYSGLLAIHKFLDQCNLTELYNPRPVTPAAPPANLAENSLREFPAAPVREPVASAPVSIPAAATLDLEAGDAEAVVILRSKSNPQAQNRIIIIHETSSKFLSYLSDELPGAEAGSVFDTRRVNNSDPLPGIGRSLRAPETGLAVARPVGDSPASKNNLQPTMLTQPEVPQRFVRGTVIR